MKYQPVFSKKKAKEASSPPKKNKEALKKAKEAFLKKTTIC